MHLRFPALRALRPIKDVDGVICANLRSASSSRLSADKLGRASKEWNAVREFAEERRFAK
jgi:hypothetical protein